MRSRKENLESSAPKKFLYSGPQATFNIDEEEDDDDEWGFSTTKLDKTTNRKQNLSNKGFNEDKVWNIKTDVAIGGSPDRKSGLNNLSMNADKSYYSRYGNLKDENAVSSIPANIPSMNPTSDKQSTAPTSWTCNGSKFSYADQNPKESSQPTSFSKKSVGHTAAPQLNRINAHPGGLSGQSSRYLRQNQKGFP